MEKKQESFLEKNGLTDHSDWAYQHIAKPTMFRFDPEDVHHRMTRFGVFLSLHASTRALVRAWCQFDHPSLQTVVDGIKFENPVGLAAGFDKNAQLWDILPDVGFGFAELGSVTPWPCPGNPRPRLFRLPKDESILVNYGLYNDGAIAIRERLKGKKFRIPVGISVARTNKPMPFEQVISEYRRAFRLMHPVGSYTTINVSCPNTADGRMFCSPDLLEPILDGVAKEKHASPVYIKIKPDVSPKDIRGIAELMDRHAWVSGVIVSNLTNHREGLNTPKSEIDAMSPKGGLSGKPTRLRSETQIRAMAKCTDKTIIGVGGIFSGQDAYAKVRAGASLVQLVTGLIYKGPRVVGWINRELVELLKKDGFDSISQAVGAK